MITNTQITYQFVAIDNASAILSQIANSLQQIQDLQKNTEKLKVGVSQTQQIAKATEEVNKNTQNINKSLGKSINLMATTKKAINFITDAIKESSSWTENLHMFEVSFGSASKEAYKFAKTIVNAFGTSQNEVIKYAGYFNQIASAIGLAEETTNKFSLALTALGYDIASLYNLNIAQAMEKLQAGVVGQTKPLRSLGMDITANSLDAYLKETMKITDTTSKMLNQADKMLLRTVVIMQQAQSVYGDMASTINTFANQIKVLQGSISNFKLAVGDLAKSTLAPFISTLAGFVIALTSIIRAFVPEEAETGIESIAGAISDVNEQLDETLNKTGLLSFDKFNSLSKSGSSSTDISALLEEEFYKRYEEYMEKFNSSVENIENNANKIALALVQWIFPLSEFNDVTGEIDINLEKVNKICLLILGTIASFFALGIITSVVSLVNNLLRLKTTMMGISKVVSTLGVTWIAIIAVLAYAYATNEDLRNSVNELIGSLFKLLGNVLSALEPMLIAIVDVLNVILEVVTPILVLIIDIINWIVQLLDKLGILEGVVYLVVGAFVIWKGLQLINFLSGVTGIIGVMATTIKTKLVQSLAAAAIGWEMMSTKAKIASLAIGAVLAVTLYSGLNAWFKDMNKETKIIAGTITTLIAVLAAGAAAWLAYHGTVTMGVAIPVILAAVGAGIAGIKAVFEGISAYEGGGYPEKGTLFIANEAGPEIVANVGGGQSAVMNIMQFEEACYRGTMRAIVATGLDTATTSKGSAVLNVNGRELARATINDFKEEADRLKIKFN